MTNHQTIKDKANDNEYDFIAENYKSSKELPFRKHIEEFTLYEMLKNKVENKNVLDLACGEGKYTRKLKEWGACNTIGVDISPGMIKLAQEEEKRNPLGGEYICSSVQGLRHIDYFDVVIGTYLFSNATNYEVLYGFCQTIYQNLKPNGCFIGIDDNPFTREKLPDEYKKYGVWTTKTKKVENGGKFNVYFKNNNGCIFKITDHHIPESEYYDAFKSAGFEDFKFIDPLLSGDAYKSQQKGFWDLFIEKPIIIGIYAKKN